METHRTLFYVISAIVAAIVLFQQLFVLSHLDIVNGIHMMDINLNKKNVTQGLFDKSTVWMRSNEVNISKFKNGSLMLYSALATNSSKNATWDVIVAQGWLEEKKTLSFACCVIHNSGDITNYKGTSAQTWYDFRTPSVKYGAIQFQCHIGSNAWKYGAPSKVAIYPFDELVDQNCVKNSSHFVDIDFVYKQSGVAVFLKILYSQLSYLDLLAWFEIHRSLGVNKVLGYVSDDLNEKARVVLGHYQRTGLFEALRYPSPFIGSRTHASQKFNYNGVSMLDGQVRFGGYDYLVSIDADEYLIPTNVNESFRDVFDRVFGGQPNISCFSFETYIFVKDWGEEGNSPFSVGRYLKRTKGTHNRVKHVVIPSRIKIGTLRTHNVVKVKNHFANTTDIALYHYRNMFNANLLIKSKHPSNDTNKFKHRNNGTRFDNMRKIRDMRVYQLFTSLDENIERTRNMYGL